MGEGGIKNGQKHSDVFYGRPLSKAKISRLNPTACVGRRGRALFVDMVFTRTFIGKQNETEKAKSGVVFIIFWYFLDNIANSMLSPGSWIGWGW